MNKKSMQEPEIGVFYLVPEPKSLKYTIYSDFGDSSLHLFLWEKISLILQNRFKKEAPDAYRGLPRGRVQVSSSGASQKRWLVGHGNDFSLDKYKGEIISQFELRDAEDAGLVDWEFTDHETMISREKEQVEKTFGIKLTKDGFKKLTPKKK